MPPSGPPRGPPIAGAGGGDSAVKLLGARKAALVALAGVIVGAGAALVPRLIL